MSEAIAEVKGASQGGTALARTEEMEKKLALAEKLPPGYREEVLALDRPTPERLGEIVAALPAGAQERVLALVHKTRPKKQGMHRSYENFLPIDMKLFQGTGPDPLRPRNCVPGQFYTAESKNMETPFEGAVIGFYQGRTLWPPRQQGDGAAQVPICASLDRKMGSKYGDCQSCPFPGKKWKEGGCVREVVVFLVDREMTGIFCLRFTRTSTPAGEALVKLLARGEEVYARWIRFESAERTDETNRYYVIKASPVIDQKHPDNEYVPKELHKLFAALSQMLDADVYYPTLAGIYGRAETAQEGVSAEGETLNEGELAGEEGKAADSADYSA